jgi:hypothetical protein
MKMTTSHLEPYSKILEKGDSLIFSHQSDKVLNSGFIHENITLVGLSTFDVYIHGVFTSVCFINNGDEM